MNKGIAIVWGILTILPTLFFFYFMSSFLSGSLLEEPHAYLDILFRLHTFNLLLTMALIVSYIVYLFRASNVPNDKKALWAVVIILVHVLAMPIFWYLYIWRPQFQKFSPAITRDENYKSNKNLIRVLLMMFFGMFLLPLAVLTAMFTYDALKSPWASLQKHYAFYDHAEYQENEYEIALSTKENVEQKTFYYTKLMLTKTGFYFASPTEFHGPISRGNIIIFLRPLLIPWAAIKECRKIQYAGYSKMRFQIEKTNILMDISLWDFLKPLCVEKGIPLIEN